MLPVYLWELSHAKLDLMYSFTLYGCMWMQLRFIIFSQSAKHSWPAGNKVCIWRSVWQWTDSTLAFRPAVPRSNVPIMHVIYGCMYMLGFTWQARHLHLSVPWWWISASCWGVFSLDEVDAGYIGCYVWNNHLKCKSNVNTQSCMNTNPMNGTQAAYVLEFL